MPKSPISSDFNSQRRSNSQTLQLTTHLPSYPNLSTMSGEVSFSYSLQPQKHNWLTSFSYGSSTEAGALRRPNFNPTLPTRVLMALSTSFQKGEEEFEVERWLIWWNRYTVPAHFRGWTAKGTTKLYVVPFRHSQPYNYYARNLHTRRGISYWDAR
jgi:hypothetical protein